MWGAKRWVAKTLFYAYDHEILNAFAHQVLRVGNEAKYLTIATIETEGHEYAIVVPARAR